MSYYEISSIQSIKLMGKIKKHFYYFYLILDSKSLAKEHESSSYDYKDEELLGERENQSKVKTPITTSTACTISTPTSQTSALSFRPSLPAISHSKTSTH